MFKWERKEADGKQGREEATIGKLIENFEKGAAKLGGGSNHKVLIPNIILMKVPIERVNKDGNIEVEHNIIGGYSPDSWLITVGDEKVSNGNTSCFLFNLTQNLRFPACTGKSFYKIADEHKLQFGDTDLVITENFKEVSSDIRRPQASGHTFTGEGDGGSHYYYGSEVSKKSKANAIIPNYEEITGKPFFEPSIVEVWTLEEAGR